MPRPWRPSHSGGTPPTTSPRLHRLSAAVEKKSSNSVRLGAPKSARASGAAGRWGAGDAGPGMWHRCVGGWPPTAGTAHPSCLEAQLGAWKRSRPMAATGGLGRGGGGASSGLLLRAEEGGGNNGDVGSALCWGGVCRKRKRKEGGRDA